MRELLSSLSIEDLIKLSLAIVMGGAIGIEREYRDKSAGFRTLIFICVGATMFTMFSEKLGSIADDPVRIASSIVSGVGFLGAGVILRDRGRITGLTTAAVIWLTAAIGMGIGGGQYLVTVAAGGAVIIVLWLFPFVERVIDNLRHTRKYHVVSELEPDKLVELSVMFKECKIDVHGSEHMKQSGKLVSTWLATGKPSDHERLMARLVADTEIQEFHF